MNVADPETVILFNHRGPCEGLGNLVFISGRKDDEGLARDGVKALHNILKDAISNHDQTNLKIPKKAKLKLKGTRNTKKYSYKEHNN